MADVLIIARERSTASALRATLEDGGYAVVIVGDAIAALPELYMSPAPLVVITASSDDAVGVSMLVAGDPNLLGRHTLVALGDSGPLSLQVQLSALSLTRAPRPVYDEVFADTATP